VAAPLGLAAIGGGGRLRAAPGKRRAKDRSGQDAAPDASRRTDGQGLAHRVKPRFIHGSPPRHMVVGSSAERCDAS
jgi:hypothetical protein